MAFPGIWMTESEKLLYCVVPKAACSSIGQILYYTEHGTFLTAISMMPSMEFINERSSTANR